MVKSDNNLVYNKESAEVAVIIVNWNGGQLLIDCLKSLDFSGNTDLIEAIVVDNNSNDGSTSRVRQHFPGVHVIPSHVNLGFGCACNLGAKATSAKILLFLNPDAVLKSDTLAIICDFLSREKLIGAVGCKVVDPDGTIQPLGVQRDPTPVLEFLKVLGLAPSSLKEMNGIFPRKNPQTSGAVHKLYGACLAIRRDVFIQINGFDDRFFMYCEDVDICRRVTDLGYGLYYLAEAEVIHNQGSCSRKAPPGFSVLMQCQSLAIYMKKYYGFLGYFFYRALMAFASTLRLASLIFLILISNRNSSFGKRLHNKWVRSWLMFQWSIYLKKAFVPN